jgi:hemolysin D
MIRTAMFKKKNTDSHEFKPLLVEIEEEPLNPLGRAVFWTILAAILFFGFWTVIGKIDVVVTARGKVIPVGEVKTVQPLSTGVVRSIKVAPGDRVERGQVLMEIDPSDTQPELESMQADLKQLELEILRLEALLKNEPFHPPSHYEPSVLRVQNEIYRSTRERLQKQIGVKHEELAQVGQRLASEEKSYEQNRYLYNLSGERLNRLVQVKDIVSRDEMDKAESDMKTHESKLKMTFHAIEELVASRARIRKEIDFIREDHTNKLLNELAEKRQKSLYLQAKIEKTLFVNRRQQITSPVEGYVAQLLIHTVGGVVTPAEKLAHIVPAESPLVIKALILNKDVGFVSQGMEATIKVDSFDFQKYGTLSGRLLQVSRDSIEDKNLGLVYEAYVQPEKMHLMVEGVETSVTIGMSVTAEIKVGKRRVIEFFIYPMIKYLDEGISVR